MYIQGSILVKIILKRKSKAEGRIQLDFKTYCKAMLVKTARYYHKDQWKRTDSKIDSRINGKFWTKIRM